MVVRVVVCIPQLQTSFVRVSPKVAWPGQPDSPAVELGIIDSVNPRPVFLPPSIPADLADRLARLHGDPIVWWVAQGCTSIDILYGLESVPEPGPINV